MALAPEASSRLWQVHATLLRSVANGPGERFVVWTQGCSLGCAGCFNPETHGPGGQARQVGGLVRQVLDIDGIDGVTITGGEPLEQPGPLSEFCGGVRRGSDLGIVLLTGFSRSEIESDADCLAAVQLVDMVVAGRYNARLHLGQGLRGSTNKEYWSVTSRYSSADFESVPETEIVVAPDGTVSITGMHAWQGE